MHCSAKLSLFHYGAKLSPFTLRCQIVLGAKLSYTQVDIMILVKAAEINPGGDMTVLKRRQCAKINGV